MKVTTFETISLKQHPELNEAWVQEQIAADPTILGLGELVLKDKERRQPTSGRLDLLFQDLEALRRYEVELQLGATDPSHIIRTIEYWDIERKRYRQYEHIAVIVAEDITSRFLNVISLFNGAIPIIAMQMKALKHEDHVGLFFTKVLDQTEVGQVDDDEEVSEPTNREYWEQRGSKKTMADVDSLLELVHQIDSGLELKYNKFYIGLARHGIADNFVRFRPQKKNVRVDVRLPRDEAVDAELENREINCLDYRSNRYRLVLSHEEVAQKREFLLELFRKAHERSGER